MCNISAKVFNSDWVGVPQSFQFFQAISKLCLNFCMGFSLLNLVLSGYQWCSQTKWQVVHGMDVHTKLGQKNQQSIFFVFHYCPMNDELGTWLVVSKLSLNRIVPSFHSKSIIVSVS